MHILLTKSFIFLVYIYRSNPDDQDHGALEGIIMARISTTSLFTKVFLDIFFFF
jgi:hypothetical protein